MITEKFLKDAGFKKKWLSDKSGYWWELTLTLKDFPAKISITVEQEMDIFWKIINMKQGSGLWLSNEVKFKISKNKQNLINAIKSIKSYGPICKR